MTKPKHTPAAKAEAPKEVASQTEAVAEHATADGESAEAVVVTSTGRVKVETKIKVEDFSERGEPAPDIYAKEPKVTKVDLGDGRFIENYE